MNTHMMKWFVYVFAFISSFTGTFFAVTSLVQPLPLMHSTVPAEILQPLEKQSFEEDPSPTKILFVGDIMLGRVVETYMDTQGLMYPFQGTEALLKEPDLTVGNFEGVVTPVHEQAKPMTFAFSIKDSFLSHLSDVGFDILSLANNHSNDYGSSSRAYMKTRCARYTLYCMGEPRELTDDSVFIKEMNGRKIGFIFIHTLYGEPSESDLRERMSELSAQSDIQIAYVHWGEEYELTHSQRQQILAELLIDLGIDAVIGHHPHVVQDIALYNGKPIFYSLGNFIFDQYFSDDVVEMVALTMQIEEQSITYEIIPLTSKYTRSQPQIMNESEKKTLITRIFRGITSESGVTAQNGRITVSSE